MLRELIINKQVGPVVEKLFGIILTTKQEDIVRSIAYAEHKRIVISCMTRYGKSYCVGIGVLLYILFHKNKRVLLIAPTTDQTNILRNYIGDFIMLCPVLSEMLDLGTSGAERLKSEVSKKRITFKNGCELKTLSAEGTGERLMGHGGDLIINDEDCLIGFPVYRARISRMLGDNPDSIMVSIGNPWDRNNQMWEHWCDPEFYKIHVGYKTALVDGRITQSFVDEQRRMLTPLEFQVLYDAEFPEEATDSLFRYKHVMAGVNKKFKHEDGDVSTSIISCDVAGQGLDLTVIMDGPETNGCYELKGVYDEPKSESMDIVGRIRAKGEVIGVNLINLDSISIGTGPVSRLREIYEKEGVLVNGKKPRIVSCHFGEAVGDKSFQSKADLLKQKSDTSQRKRFLNKKAQMYFRLRGLFEEGRISIPDHPELIKQLLKMRFGHTSSGRIHIIDPEEKSPDFADALVYFIWKEESSFVMNFGGES